MACHELSLNSSFHTSKLVLDPSNVVLQFSVRTGHEAFAMIFGNLLQPLKECQRDYNGFLSGINDRRFAGQPLAEGRISCLQSVDFDPPRTSRECR